MKTRSKKLILEVFCSSADLMTIFSHLQRNLVFNKHSFSVRPLYMDRDIEFTSFITRLKATCTKNQSIQDLSLSAFCVLTFRVSSPDEALYLTNLFWSDQLYRDCPRPFFIKAPACVRTAF